MNQLQIPIALIILLRPGSLGNAISSKHHNIFKSKCWILKLYTITGFESEANGVQDVNRDAIPLLSAFDQFTSNIQL